MDKVHKETLQVTKEIVVKFIETGRVSPANFAEIFPSVYTVVRRTLVDAQFPALPEENLPDEDARETHMPDRGAPEMSAPKKNAKGKA